MLITLEQAKEAIRLYPQLTTEMKISGQALDVYLFVRVRGKGVTTDEVSNVWDISIQHSNQIMKTLIKKGYVTRKESRQESGGYEFIYKAI